jgi:hypothetical protein
MQAAQDLVTSPAARELEVFVDCTRNTVNTTMALLVQAPNALAQKVLYLFPDNNYNYIS